LEHQALSAILAPHRHFVPAARRIATHARVPAEATQLLVERPVGSNGIRFLLATGVALLLSLSTTVFAQEGELIDPLGGSIEDALDEYLPDEDEEGEPDEGGEEEAADEDGEGEEPASDEPAVDEYADPAVDEYVDPAVDEYVDPAVDEYADPAVDEYVDPAVDEYADPAVDEYADPAVDEYVDPAVDEYVDPVVDEYADPAVDEYVDPAVDEYVDPAVDEYAEPVIDEPVVEEPPTDVWDTPPPTTTQTSPIETNISDPALGAGGGPTDEELAIAAENREDDGPENPEATEFVFAPRGGFGLFTEDFRDQSTNEGVGGLALRWDFTYRSRIFATAMASFHERIFVPLGVGQSGTPIQIINDEWVIDADLGYGWDAWRNASHSFWLNTGWRHMAFLNSGFNQQVSGPFAGIELSVKPARLLQFRFFGDFTYNMVSLADRAPRLGESLVRRVEFSPRFGGGLRVFPTPLLQLGLTYEGEYLKFERSNVYLHEFILEVGFSFRI
jgi:hypothetical protein